MDGFTSGMPEATKPGGMGSGFPGQDMEIERKNRIAQKVVLRLEQAIEVLEQDVIEKKHEIKDISMSRIENRNILS